MTAWTGNALSINSKAITSFFQGNHITYHDVHQYECIQPSGNALNYCASSGPNLPLLLDFAETMQHILQNGLKAGLSATSGFHSKKGGEKSVSSDHDGLAYVLPDDFIPTPETRITLKGAQHDVQVPWISWGAWSWGDVATWQWDDGTERPALREAWKQAVQKGLIFIDTAQAYGSGESEKICGELFQGMPRDSFVIQTKWYVVPDNPTNLTTGAPAKFLRESLDRMGLDYVDIYLVHGPIHPRSISTVAKGVAECVEKGWTKVVGCANYSAEDMAELADELAKYHIPLATNQCEYSLLRRYPETHGLLAECRKRGIVFQSYSSLAQGRLSGKYGPGNEPPKTHRFSNYPMKDIVPVLEVVNKIASRRNVSPAAVALNYNISKGVLPVVGIRNPSQMEGDAQALGWRLAKDEMEKLDQVGFEGKSTKLWQQG